MCKIRRTAAAVELSLDQYLLDVLGEFAGGRGGAQNDLARFGLGAIFWALIWVSALLVHRRLRQPREALLLLGFGVGVAHMLFMLTVKSLKLYGVVPAETVELFFPPLDHALTLVTRGVIAAAFLLYLLGSRPLALGYLKACLLVSAVFYAIVAPLWWSIVTESTGVVKFSHYWVDELAHALGAVLTVVALVLLSKARGWILAATSAAFVMFLLDDVLMLINLATDEVYKPAFAPIRHNLQLWAIPLFGYIYWREQIETHAQVLRERERSERLEVVGRMASGVAHDFNNHLQVILGYAELGKERPDEPKTVEHAMEQIEDTVERAGSLVGQLFAFGRDRTEGIEEAIGLDDLVGEFTPMLTRVLGPEIEIVYRLEPDLPNVVVDRSRAEQIILNLLINARDAMPDGGTLTLGTSLGAPPDPESGRADARSRRVLLSVSDTGVGMSAETRRRVFEPFFTTKPLGEGTGLGLATVHSIVAAAGGSVGIESERGVGTTVTVSLPVGTAADGAHHEVRRARSTADVTGLDGSATVLLAEDEPALRSLAAGMLESAGYDVLTARDGEEAVAIALDTRHSIDLLLFDIAMPKMNGYRARRRIRGHLPDVPVLFMSANRSHPQVRRSRDPHLAKPFDRTRLLVGVRDALRRARDAAPTEASA